MKTIMSLSVQQRCTISAATAATLLWICNPSLAIEKCDINGSITYTDQPCPKDAVVEPFIPHASAPNDPDAARQRYQSDLKQLKQIEQQKTVQQQQRESDARAAAKYNRAVAVKAAQCHRLDTKRQWFRQQLSELGRMANKKQLERARHQLNQTEEDYQLHCQLE